MEIKGLPNNPTVRAVTEIWYENDNESVLRGLKTQHNITLEG